MRFIETMAIALPLLFKPVERVLEAGNGSERGDCDRKIDLVGGTSALERGGVAI